MANEKQKPEQKVKKIYAPGKVILRVNPKHPNGKYNLLSKTIERQFKEYDLSAEEMAELDSEGPQAWLEIGDNKKMEADKKLHDDIKAKP